MNAISSRALFTMLTLLSQILTNIGTQVGSNTPVICDSTRPDYYAAFVNRMGGTILYR